jgi:hypothetical protein
MGQHGRRHWSQKTLRSESLSPRRHGTRDRTFTLTKRTLRDSELPHEMSYPTAQKLQYGVTPAQESAPQRPHVLTSRHDTACFPPHRNPTDFCILHCRKACSMSVLTASPAHIEYLSRAALKRRHVSFRKTGCCRPRAKAPMSRHRCQARMCSAAGLEDRPRTSSELP